MQRRGSVCNDKTAHTSVVHSTDTSWEGYRETRKVSLRSNQQSTEKQARIAFLVAAVTNVLLHAIDRQCLFSEKGSGKNVTRVHELCSGYGQHVKNVLHATSSGRWSDGHVKHLVKETALL